MKFLIDAQLPARLARELSAADHDAIHALSLPKGNKTSDDEVALFADTDARVVVSKDRDFRDGFLLRNTPSRLLLVETGNISNDDLITLFEKHLSAIVDASTDRHTWN